MSEAAFMPLTWPEAGPKPHPFANIFRMLAGDEKDELQASIGLTGLKTKVMIFADQILDGRNRYLCLVDLGLFDPAIDWRSRLDLFEEFSGTEQEAFDLVWALNHNRRHDTPQQRAMSAARRANMPQGFRSDLASPETPSANLRPLSQAEAALAEGVSERSVNSASRVIRKGTPELQQAVDENRVSLHVAEHLTDLTPEEQRELVDGDRDEVKQRLKARAPRKAPERRPSNTELLAEVERTERVSSLSGVAFTRFAQSVLNLARGGKDIAAASVVDLAAQNRIVRTEADGFVLTDEALAAMGNLAVGQPKQRVDEVRSPLPHAPSPGEHVEFTVGGLRDKAAASFSVHRETAAGFAIATSYSFPNRGGATPRERGFTRFEDAVATAAFRLCTVFEGIVNSTDSVTTDKEKSAARGALHWFGNKLAGWGIVAGDKAAAPAPGDDDELNEADREAAYIGTLTLGREHKGKHTKDTAEPIVRAGIAAGRTGQQIADDLGHPIGTFLTWKSRLDLAGKGEGRAAPRKRKRKAGAAA